MELVSVDDVRRARETLRGVVRETPLEHSRALADLVGGPVHLKCENLQRTGSFKIRGAYVRLSRLAPAERGRGVVAASAGNHAQGVALAASLLGIPCTVLMPAAAALPKVAATRAYGAAVELVGGTLADCLEAAEAHAERTGAVLVHPFDNPHLIAGQGTVGLEILEQCPEVRTVLVCTGGGGLVSGVAAAVKGLRPDVRVVAVQAAGAASLPGSLAAGAPVALEGVSTMADGIAVAEPSRLTLDHVARLVDDVATVDDEAISRALLLCLERGKLLVEPAGVVGVAALMERPAAFEPPVVAVLSGGNIDPVLLMGLLRNGMASAGRYLSLRLRIPDRPGMLAALLGLIADAGANVLDVEHSRIRSDLHLGEVAVAVSLETLGDEHCRGVLAALRAAGHDAATAGADRGD